MPIPSSRPPQRALQEQALRVLASDATWFAGKCMSCCLGLLMRHATRFPLPNCHTPSSMLQLSAILRQAILVAGTRSCCFLKELLLRPAWLCGCAAMLDCKSSPAESTAGPKATAFRSGAKGRYPWPQLHNTCRAPGTAVPFSRWA